MRRYLIRNISFNFIILSLLAHPFGHYAIADEDFENDFIISSEAAELQNQVNDFNRTIAEGAVIGSIAGAFLGKALGGDNKDALKGALAGAAVGAASGNYLANQKKQAAEKEQALETLKQEIIESNQSIAGMIETADKVLQADRKRLQDLETQISQNRQRQQDYEQMIVEVQNNRDIIAQAITATDKKYQKHLASVESIKTKDNAKQHKEVQASLKQYKHQKNALVTIDKEMEQLIKDSRRRI